MRAYRQKNDCFIGQIFTKAKLAILNITAFFTDNKNYPEVAVNTGTAAARQVQFAAGVTKKLGIVIRIVQDSLDSPFNGLPYG